MAFRKRLDAACLVTFSLIHCIVLMCLSMIVNAPILSSGSLIVRTSSANRRLSAIPSSVACKIASPAVAHACTRSRSEHNAIRISSDRIVDDEMSSY